VIAGAIPARRSLPFERPSMQWEAPRGAGALTVRLFGTLDSRALARVCEAIAERGRAPRDLVVVDFEQVEHLDYRALPDFARAALSQTGRGANVVFVGLSRYLRDLFDIAGQGPTLRRLEWQPVEEAVPPRRAPFPLDSELPNPGRERRLFTL
jgi:ABC-type transporter Mla MlaB component